MAVIGLVPAAGYATRLGLTSGSKEVQPVRGRPVMEYLLERMVRAGAERIRVATRPEKADVADLAARHRAEVVAGHPASVSESLRLAASGLSDDEIVMFGFPDTIWSPLDGFVRLVEQVRSGEPIALGVFESPHPERSDVAILGTDGRIVRIDVKPGHTEATLVWGCGVARLGVLRAATDGFEPGQGFDRMARRSPLAAALLGRVIDVGTPASIEEAERDPVFADT
jgi:glucose-1-phosphate thymidylyltransferase